MSTLENSVFRILGEEDNTPAKANKAARDRTTIKTTRDNLIDAANTRSNTATLHRFASKIHSNLDLHRSISDSL